MSPKRLLLILAILFSCVGCDQATKSVAKAYLSETQPIILLGDTVRLELAKNYGAFLSLGSAIGESSRGMLLSATVGLVLAALLVYLFVSKPQNPLVGAAIALVVGGGVSNLVDRLRYGGYVVDFLNVGIGSLRTGISYIEFGVKAFQLFKQGSFDDYNFWFCFKGLQTYYFVHYKSKAL